MKETEYINTKIVQKFIDWMLYRMNHPGAFQHSFVIDQSKKEWECNSIYSAYENYIWDFKYKEDNEKIISGSTYQENEKVLSDISRNLLESIQNNNNEKCLSTCREVLEWGGVLRSNYQKVLDLGEERCSYFKKAKKYLETDEDLEWFRNLNLHMSSGFTKIYSLIANDFIIYDSRVGAALCYFVRKFCEENNIDEIPIELRFSWGVLRKTNNWKIANNPRNPNAECYKFPMITNRRNAHLDSNIRANWLIKELHRKDSISFGSFEKQKGLRAIEAALFMIGYKVR